jgi:hypothetical protein
MKKLRKPKLRIPIPLRPNRIKGSRKVYDRNRMKREVYG